MKHHASLSLNRVSKTLVACFGIALCVVFTAGQGFAQTTTTSSTDGSTPLGLAPGAPAGSYRLSGFDTINPYNGKLDFHLPLVSAGGRGRAPMAAVLAINAQTWRVKRAETIDPNTGLPIDTYLPEPNWWTGLIPGYGPGVLQGRQSGVFPTQSCAVTHASKIYQQTLTRLTFTASDGTEYELRDQLTGGQPATVSDPCANGASRGTIFVTADGTAATFISDTVIRDSAQSTSAGLYPSGYLALRDGTRLRIDAGLVSWMRDANGNKLSFTYDAFRRVTQIADSLNRTVTITYQVSDVAPYGLSDQITYKGFGGATRTIRVSYTSLSSALRPNSGYIRSRPISSSFPN